ncbi:MAG: PAS domain S-box protein, partial [Chlorobiaceae bacterium]|nr:PAS domain S-box protein [Chlorobiaceae bacterium]
RDVDVFCNISRMSDKPVFYCIVNDVTDQNRAERELLESKRLLQAALESMSDAIFISDSEGRFIEFNNAFATFHRFSNKQECLKKLSEYPEIIEVFLADGTPAPLAEWAVSRALRGETGIAVEYGLRRKETGESWIGSYNFAPLLDKNGRITGSVVSGRDITILKNAENALKKSEERFRNFFEKHTAVMLLVDLETQNIVDANRSAAEFYGWKHERLCRMNIREINASPPETIEKILKKWNESENRSFETVHKKAGGSTCDVEVFAQKIIINGKAIVYAIIHDITERKLVEEKLKKLSFAIEQSPAVVVITDPEGNIEYVNPTFTKHTGYSFEEAKGENPRILKSGYMPREFYEHLWNTILSGKVWHGEFHNKKKNGEFYWEDAFISAIRNESAEITNFVAVKEDITEKKKLWNELVSSKDKAEESDRLKSAFLNNISHEIRTPMNGILGFSELLKEPQLTGEEQDEYIGHIQQSGERMMKLINDIMEISRIDAKETLVEIAETPLNSLLENLFDEFSRVAETKRLQLSWKAGLPDSESIIETDGAKLQLVISNLLENALKFTHEGHVDFGYEKKDTLLEFYVVDSGVGVPEEMKEKIFERFCQIDNSLSRIHEGTGLGLSITKAYIEMLGGIIHVEPCSCGGSKFFFTLPYTPAGKPEPVQPTASKSSAKPLLTIVIAEDDEVSALLLKKTLKSENIVIFTASNGRETVELVRQHPETDLVLMDIKMPEMNGYEATRLIKQMRPDLLVIAQTAFASTEDREKAFYAGCDGFLTKPVKKSELLDMMRALIGK